MTTTPRRILPRLAKAAGVLALIVLLGLIALGFGLRWLGSPEGSRWALGYAQSKMLTSKGIALSYDEARLQVFSGFHFRNLKAVWSSDAAAVSASGAGGAQGKAEFSAESLDLVYTFSLWSRSFTIESFRAQKLRLQANARLADAPAAPAPTPAPNGDALEKLADLIRRPPVAVRARDIVVSDLAYDVRVARAGRAPLNATSVGRCEKLATEFELAGGRLISKGDGACGLDLRASSNAPEPNGPTKTVAAFNAMGSGRWDAGVRYESGRWIYELAALEGKGRVAKFSAEHSARAAAGETKLDARMQDLSGEWRGTARAETKRLFAPETDAMKSLDVALEARVLGFRFAQTPPHAPAHVLAVASKTSSITAKLDKDIVVRLRARAEGVEAKPTLARPVQMLSSLELRVPRDLSRAHIDGAVELEKIEVARWSAEIERKPASALGFDVQARLNGDARLAKFAPAAAALAKMGSPRLELAAKGAVDKDGRVEFSAKGGTARVLLPASPKPFEVDFTGDGVWETASKTLNLHAGASAANADFGRWRVGTKTVFALTADGFTTQGQSEAAQTTRGPKAPIVLAKAIAIAHEAQNRKGAMTAKLSIDVPSAQAPKIATAENTRIKMELRAPSPGEQEAEISVDQGRIHLAAGSPIPIEGAKLQLKARIKDQAAFTVERFAASLNGEFAQMSGEMRGNLKTKDVQATLFLSAKIPAKFPAVGGARVSGALSAPITLALRRGQDLSIEGEARLEGLSAIKDAISVRGISGRVPFSERLTLDLKKATVRFASLIDQNPFERVNFERLRPLIQKAQPLTIERIGWMEKSYGPFVGVFSARQNMLFAHQFDLNLGLGRVYGELFLDAYPKTMRMGFLGRLTGLDLGDFLPATFLMRVPEGNRVVSGRAGVVVDVNKAAVDGRVDVTSIGGPQLIAMINVLDPKFEDPKLNTARSLLEIGYPTGVAIALQQGYMDMDIDLKALGISKRQSIRGIPLSGFITQHTSGIVDKTRKGPLQ